MATAGPRTPVDPASTRVPTSPSASFQDAQSPSAGAPVAPANAKSKKGKLKKATDPSETGKLLAAKINQLELDAAGEKDQEQEIEREVRKATRDLNNLLAGMGNPMERMEALQKKNQDLFTDMKRLEREHAKSKKRADQVQKERDSNRSELSKTTTMKEKLEKLARELTKDNKKLKEDLKRLEDSERKSREALGEKTDSLISNMDDIIFRTYGPQLQSQSAEVNELFRQKFKSFFDQYNLRELHFLSLIRTKETELQHGLARLESQRKIAESETARSRQLTSQVSTFSQTETELRSQLNIYVEKFKQVEDTLNNSNDLFLTFRKEMEDMSKKTKRLEKENMNLTRKHDITNRNIMSMVEERDRTTKEMETLRKKNGTLESVIRRMQEQGRGGAIPNGLDMDEDGTESDYDGSEDEEGEYDVGSEEVEYEDDTEEDLAVQSAHKSPQAFGPLPPPPPADPGSSASHVNGVAKGVP